MQTTKRTPYPCSRSCSRPAAVETAESVLRAISLTIVSLFQAEMVCRLLAFGPRHFIEDWLTFLDAGVRGGRAGRAGGRAGRAD